MISNLFSLSDGTMLIALFVNLYDPCLRYYQEKILTPTHYLGKRCEVCPIFAIFMQNSCRLLPVSKPAPVLRQRKSCWPNFHATITAQTMAGI